VPFIVPFHRYKDRSISAKLEQDIPSPTVINDSVGNSMQRSMDYSPGCSSGTKIITSDLLSYTGKKNIPIGNMDSIILASNEDHLSSPDNNYRTTQM
jgi:hypothetical protein